MAITSRPGLLFSLGTWILITILGVYLILNINKYVNFGIDLVGGTYITLEVEVDKAIETDLLDKMQHVVKKLQDEKKAAPSVPLVENSTGILKFESAAAATDAYNILSSEQDKRFIVKQDDKNIKLNLTSEAVNILKKEAVEGNINVLRTRLDTFGVGEITIAAQGDKYIIIELPNVDDPQKAKDRIGRTALLEMKPVYDVASTKDALIDKHGGQIPEGTVVLPHKEEKDNTEKFFLVPTYASLTGRLLKNAEYRTQTEDFSMFKGSPHAVSIQFKSEGEEKFAELTRKNIGGRIAIIIDNVVISAPSVSSEITGGGAIISGSFTKPSATELASLLKSGAFVAPVKYVEERHIEASLGKESVRNGLISCVIALILLFLFSVITYKVAGIFAFIVLVYNLMLILFGLASIGATLTLPGIAGMVLTIGMAIDASILIYERIKEELAQGSSMSKAVDVGFSGATAVILDANITHFLVSIVLYWLGTGPIQGFASIMIIGIISTLITGLLLLKTIFKFTLDGLGFRTVKI